MGAFLGVKNRAESELASGISGVAASLTVPTAEGSRFPASNFAITIDDERILVTSRTLDTFTLGQRGYDGSTAASHDAAAKVELRVIAQNVVELQDRLVAGVVQVLTDGANIAWNLTSGGQAKVTLGGNRTLDNPTNLVAGASYTLRVIQDNSGSRTLAYGTAYLWPGDEPPTLTAAGNATDVLVFLCDGTSLLGISAVFDVK